MRRAAGPILVGTLLLATAPGGARSSPPAAPPAKIRWAPAPVEQHLSYAADNDLLFLLVFGAEWCGWCRQLERETLGSAVLEEVLEAYIPLYFDLTTDAGGGAARRYAVQGLPTMLILDARGLVLDRAVGFRTDLEMLEFLQSARMSSLSIETLIERASSPQADADELERVGRTLIERGREEDGRRFLDRAIERAPPGSPAAARALMSLASAALQRGETAQAKSLLRRACEEVEDPDLAREAFTSAISLFRDAGTREERIGIWEMFASRLPTDPTVQEDYARALDEFGLPPETVLEAADRAANLAPDAGGPQAIRAKALYSLGRLPDALDAASLSVRLDPEGVEARVLRLRIIEDLRRGSGRTAEESREEARSR